MTSRSATGTATAASRIRRHFIACLFRFCSSLHHRPMHHPLCLLVCVTSALSSGRAWRGPCASIGRDRTRWRLVFPSSAYMNGTELDSRTVPLDVLPEQQRWVTQLVALSTHGLPLAHGRGRRYTARLAA
jgi:hypothetical protein